MPAKTRSFARADDDEAGKGKPDGVIAAAPAGRKPVKQVLIWTGIICVIALLINMNVSRLQTTGKGGVQAGSLVQSSVSAQGDNQCISPHKGCHC